MNEARVESSVPPSWKTQLDKHIVAVFCVVTVIITVLAILWLPTLAGPLVVVFVPVLTAVILIALTQGRSQIRPQLFSRSVWRISLKWAAISLGAALALRVGVSLVGLVAGYPFQLGPLSPLLIMTFLFAAGEEIGWRGFALPRLLANGRSPLTAAVLLGIPWALLHLPLVLPGKLSAGMPPAAQFMVMISLSMLLTWVYLGAGRSLLAATLLHGGQNALVILNEGLPANVAAWGMAIVYFTAAFLVILLTKGRLGQSTPEINRQVA